MSGTISRVPDAQDLAAAYRPFVESLLTGGFVEPSDRWGTALIAARVASNNERIAVLTEQFVRGERPSYDNARVIDDEQLRQFVAAAGGLGDVGG